MEALPPPLSDQAIKALIAERIKLRMSIGLAAGVTD